MTFLFRAIRMLLVPFDFVAKTLCSNQIRWQFEFLSQNMKNCLEHCVGANTRWQHYTMSVFCSYIFLTQIYEHWRQKVRTRNYTVILWQVFLRYFSFSLYCYLISLTFSSFWCACDMENIAIWLRQLLTDSLVSFSLSGYLQIWLMIIVVQNEYWINVETSDSNTYKTFER